MIAGISVRGKDVEYCSQELQSKSGAIVWRRRYGRAKIRGDLGKKDRRIRGLSDKMNEEVVSSGEFLN